MNEAASQRRQVPLPFDSGRAERTLASLAEFIQSHAGAILGCQLTRALPGS